MKQRYAAGLEFDLTPDELDRFRRRCGAPDANGCVPWLGGKQNGYGAFWIRGMCQKAHRIAYRLAAGPIPKGLVVMHTCDVCHCVNPGHLRLGTQRENMADKVRKGRARGGTVGNNGPRLTPELVFLLRQQKKAGARTADLARSVGMRWPDMWLVLTGRSWKNVPMP